jgi:hypothetical protein
MKFGGNVGSSALRIAAKFGRNLWSRLFDISD